MAVDVTKEEFESRVRVLEREVEGEKLVTRYILEQTRRNGDDLAAIKGKIEGVDLKGLVRKVDEIDRKVNGLDRKVDGLVKNLPRIVGEAVRNANRNGRKR
jgi:uncharacterized protein YoxC